MNRYNEAVQQARDLADDLAAEINRRTGDGPTGRRGQLHFMGGHEALRELRKERETIVRHRAKLKHLDENVDSSFAIICEEIGIPFTPGESSGS